LPILKDYKVARENLDHPGINEFERKRPPPKAPEDPEDFDDYIIDEYIFGFYCLMLRDAPVFFIFMAYFL